MAKIICITSGLTGMLNASFELARRLELAGHELLCASPKPVAEKVTRQGFAYAQLPHIPTDPGPVLPSFSGAFRKWRRLLYKLSQSRSRQARALTDIWPAALVELLDKEGPDLLIIDVELHEYIMAAYAKKYHFILLSQWFSLWPQPGLPYLLHDTLPGQGWSGSRWGMRWSWIRVRLQRWYTFTRKKMVSGGTDRRSMLLALARQRGFPRAYIRKNFWPGPFLYDHLPVISMTAAEMEFPHTPRPGLHYVGPMVFENRFDREVHSIKGLPLTEVLEKQRRRKTRLIYCSVSTLSEGDEGFIRKLLEAVKDCEDWTVILGLGRLVENFDAATLPGNVYAFAFLPQLKVLASADCSINHGGIHTINECIHFRVPMLVYSGKKSDQNGCAARVHYHGLGIMADKDGDDPPQIAAKIGRILSDPVFRQNVKQMNEGCQRYKKSRYLEKLVQNFLSLGNESGVIRN